MKTPRQIAIADHLWDAFERMAEEMGAERDQLVNQAMHVFARLNGFLVPGAAEGGPPPPIPRGAAAEQVLREAERLERGIGGDAAAGEGAAPASLFLAHEAAAPVEVVKDRFVIGRGKECDLVIDSGKVSREHAVISREADGWFIEDLGSSNGTWHRRERVTRKRIEDGDEFFICSEKIRCELR